MEFTRKRVPLDWAITKSNLGNVLRKRGEREKETKLLEEAVKSCRAALGELIRERAPLKWAEAFGCKAVALLVLARQRRDLEMAEIAASQIDEAFTLFRDGGHQVMTADFSVWLEHARALVSRLKQK